MRKRLAHAERREKARRWRRAYGPSALAASQARQLPSACRWASIVRPCGASSRNAVSSARSQLKVARIVALALAAGVSTSIPWRLIAAVSPDGWRAGGALRLAGLRARPWPRPRRPSLPRTYQGRCGAGHGRGGKFWICHKSCCFPFVGDLRACLGRVAAAIAAIARELAAI